MDTKDFLHEDNHQGKVGSETATFDLVWPVVPLMQSYSFIVASLERINWYLNFLLRISHQDSI